MTTLEQLKLELWKKVVADQEYGSWSRTRYEDLAEKIYAAGQESAVLHIEKNICDIDLNEDSDTMFSCTVTSLDELLKAARTTQ